MHQRRFTNVLIMVCSVQTTLFVCVVLLIWYLNRGEHGFFAGFGVERIWENLGLLGFSGSLLYFQRKSYVYLITNKFARIHSGADISKHGKFDGKLEVDDNYLRSRLRGYYLYLTLRPLAGLMIGPLLAAVVLGGLFTLSNSTVVGSSGLSDAGVYFLLSLAFVGGYTSSDMFDYVSRLGDRLRPRTGL